MKKLEFLTGRTTDQLVPFLETKFLVHKEMAGNLEQMVKRAMSDGIELSFSSTFRSYIDQLAIWNRKASGLRAVLDSDSSVIDIAQLTKEELLFKILRWSAIPGASRHHWGTDFDVFDQRAMALDYKVQLIPSEYEEGGPFFKASLWLLENMSDFGFYRPYEVDTGGIAIEPWHLSYKPLSQQFMEQFSFEIFLRHLELSDFLLLDEAKLNAAQIYQRFIKIS